MTYREAKNIEVGARLFTYRMNPNFKFTVASKEVQGKDVFFVTEDGRRVHHRNVGGFAPVPIVVTNHWSVV